MSGRDSTVSRAEGNTSMDFSSLLFPIRLRQVLEDDR